MTPVVGLINESLLLFARGTVLRFLASLSSAGLPTLHPCVRVEKS